MAADEGLLAVYDRALPIVYGYLFDRCGDRATAEDLTSETFLACVDTMRTRPQDVSVPWVVGVARHKLVDHWRRRSRDERLVAAAAVDEGSDRDDPWDVVVDAVRASAVLGSLGGHHRAALTLRYVDALSVPEVADVLGRTVHATEALLVRARRAFRRAYESGGSSDG